MSGRLGFALTLACVSVPLSLAPIIHTPTPPTSLNPKKLLQGMRLVSPRPQAAILAGRLVGRKLAALLIPPSLDSPDVVLGEGVGHIEPVHAVVRAGITVGSPRQPASVILDGDQKAGELAREVILLGHAPIVHLPQPSASINPKKLLQGRRVVTRRRGPAILAGARGLFGKRDIDIMQMIPSLLSERESTVLFMPILLSAIIAEGSIGSIYPFIHRTASINNSL